jgi:copper chaperone CopZ
MTTTTEYLVSGMTCDHCVDAVSAEVSALPGVTEATVELATGVLTVVSDTHLPVSEIERAVDEAGYTLATG